MGISVLEGSGGQPASAFARHLGAFAVPWVLAAAIWLLREDSPPVRRLAIAASVATSCVHLVLMGFNLRGLFPAAYFADDLWTREIQSKRLLAGHAFVRFYPAGIYLMMATVAVLLCVAILGQNRRAKWAMQITAQSHKRNAAISATEFSFLDLALAPFGVESVSNTSS